MNDALRVKRTLLAVISGRNLILMVLNIMLKYDTTTSTIVLSLSLSLRRATHVSSPFKAEGCIIFTDVYFMHLF